MDGAQQFCFTRAALMQAFAARLGRVGLSSAETNFIDQAHEDCGPGEFPDMSAEDVAAGLAELWRFAQTEGEAPLIRLVDAQGADGRDLKRDRLEIVQPDAPFLVDSVMGELSANGFRVRAMFHPLVELPRGEGAWSLIQVYLEPIGDDRREALLQGVRETLSDVRMAVHDHHGMVQLVRRATGELQRAAPRKDPEALGEAIAFLEWLAADNFVFLGGRVYDFPRSEDGGYAAEAPLFTPEDGCGILRDPARLVLRRANEPAILTSQLQRQLDLDEPVVVGKANLNSRVHRRVRMDYVTIRRYGATAAPPGEFAWWGCSPAEAYDRPA
jgi:glutamate dehydrogenase